MEDRRKAIANAAEKISILSRAEKRTLQGSFGAHDASSRLKLQLQCSCAKQFFGSASDVVCAVF